MAVVAVAILVVLVFAGCTAIEPAGDEATARHAMDEEAALEPPTQDDRRPDDNGTIEENETTGNGTTDANETSEDDAAPGTPPDPALPGPYEWVQERYEIHAAGAGPGAAAVEAIPLEVHVYRPSAEGRFPVLLWLHGLGDTSSNYDAWGEHVAGWGITVLMPTHRGTPLAGDHENREAEALAVLEWAREGPLSEGLDVGRLTLLGFSYGGPTSLDVTLAEPRGWDQQGLILLDPADLPDNNAYLPKAGQVEVPRAYIGGSTYIRQFSPVPLITDWFAPEEYYHALPQPRFGLRIEGADHLDFMEPGPPIQEHMENDSYLMFAKRHVTAAALLFTSCDSDVEPYLWGAVTQQETTDGHVTPLPGSSRVDCPSA